MLVPAQSCAGRINEHPPDQRSFYADELLPAPVDRLLLFSPPWAEANSPAYYRAQALRPEVNALQSDRIANCNCGPIQSLRWESLGYPCALKYFPWLPILREYRTSDLLLYASSFQNHPRNPRP